MIALGLLAFAAMAIAITTTRARGSRAFAAVCVLPLLITVGLTQLPFDRKRILDITLAGIALSVLLFAVGVVLTTRAMRSRDGIAALWLGAETVVAALPAVIIGLYYVAFRS